jgi:hypothetical protein
MLKMTAAQFNETYPVGSPFTYKPDWSHMDAKVVRTVGVAQKVGGAVVVEINLDPHFANLRSLTPTG